jgi:hypothetical protein
MQRNLLEHLMVKAKKQPDAFEFCNKRPSDQEDPDARSFSSATDRGLWPLSLPMATTQPSMQQKAR